MHFQVNKWLSFGLIVVIFGVVFLRAQEGPPRPDEEDDEAPSPLQGRSDAGPSERPPSVSRGALVEGEALGLRLQAIEQLRIAPFALREIVHGDRE